MRIAEDVSLRRGANPVGERRTIVEQNCLDEEVLF